MPRLAVPALRVLPVASPAPRKVVLAHIFRASLTSLRVAGPDNLANVQVASHLTNRKHMRLRTANPQVTKRKYPIANLAGLLRTASSNRNRAAISERKIESNQRHATSAAPSPLRLRSLLPFASYLATTPLGPSAHSPFAREEVPHPRRVRNRDRMTLGRTTAVQPARPAGPRWSRFAPPTPSSLTGHSRPNWYAPAGRNWPLGRHT